MLFRPPPGYGVNAPNRQTVGGLGAPGIQSLPVTPGASHVSNPYQSSPAGGLNYGASSYAPQSSYSVPSSMPTPNQAPPLMHQYNNSPNRSTLLRVLLGKTR
jgi:hypothetical protein